jgi:hypothetical protein
MKIMNVPNPTTIDPNIILINHHCPPIAHATLFTHNYKVKNYMVQLIMDNNNQNNVVCPSLVKELDLLITPQYHSLVNLGHIPTTLSTYFRCDVVEDHEKHWPLQTSFLVPSQF